MKDQLMVHTVAKPYALLKKYKDVHALLPSLFEPSLLRGLLLSSLQRPDRCAQADQATLSRPFERSRQLMAEVSF